MDRAIRERTGSRALPSAFYRRRETDAPPDAGHRTGDVALFVFRPPGGFPGADQHASGGER